MIALFNESILTLVEPKLNPPSPTSKPPIEADTNLAKPCDVIEEDAFWSVDGAPAIVAGVLILVTVKSAFIIASAPITSNSFFGSK